MSGKRKLVFLAAGLGTGGTERHLVRLTTGLAERGWEPAVLNAGESGRAGDNLDRAGIPVRSFRPPVSIRDLGAFARLVALLHRERPALVHSYLYAAHWLDAVAARLVRVPYVDSRRNLAHWRQGPANARERLRGRLSAAVVANSAAAARQARIDGAPAATLRVIPNGVRVRTDDASRLGAARERARRRLGIARSSRVVGSVASLKKIKAPDILLEAFARRADARTDDRLVLVGSGPLLESLRAAAARLGQANTVIFAGACDEPADLLPAFDVFVSSSLSEGFSNAVIEAMAAGLPVVASAVGGNVEAVVDHETGLLVKPGDPAALGAALDTVLAMSDRGASWGRRGRTRTRYFFSLDKMIEAHLDLYSRLLSLPRAA